MAIIISKNGKGAKKVEKSSFEKENYIQEYIINNPESIPLYDIKEDIRLLILAREFHTTHGPIDALGVDMEGQVYLIETKLYRNADKRSIVAQVLDYGASLWRSYGDFTDFMAELDIKVRDKFKESTAERVKEFFGIEDEDAVRLLDNVRQNMSKGNYRFVVLLDKVDDRLKDLILFINENSKFDLFGVEFEYYKHEDYEIIIPKLFGAEVKKDITVSSASGPRRNWDEDSFLKEAQTNLTQEQFQSVKKLCEFSKATADEISWGTGATRASFGPKFSKVNDRSLFTVKSTGKISLNFRWFRGVGDSMKYRDKFKELIEINKVFALPEDAQNQFVNLGIEEWYRNVDGFISVIKDLLKQ